uniref:protein-tyrosine-phosphatase n=1 Tax=Trichuris muris TaxID=70415 RepID=A0A5S6QH74_TRIMR
MDAKVTPLAWLNTLSRTDKEELLKRIKTEHRQIPGGPGNEAIIGPCRLGAERLPKCRYTNVPCLETTRVVVRDMPPEHDFIHANFVRFTNAPCPFIAAMAPEADTIGLFWSVLWHENVDVIICLTNLTEKGKPKTAKYWPDYDEEFEIEDIRVRLTELHKEETFRCSTLLVRNVRSHEERMIEHLLYKDWPDHAGPNCTHSVLSIIEKIIEYPPKCILVHCSAGVGRTGTFIALVMLMIQVNAGEAPDVAAAVKVVRSMRPWAVQASIQYTFLYWAMVVYILQKSDISRADKFVLHEKLSYLRGASSGSLCGITIRPAGGPSAMASERVRLKKKKGDKRPLARAVEFIDKRNLLPATPTPQPVAVKTEILGTALNEQEAMKQASWNETQKEEVNRAVIERVVAKGNQQPLDKMDKQPEEASQQSKKPPEGANQPELDKLPDNGQS